MQMVRELLANLRDSGPVRERRGAVDPLGTVWLFLQSRAVWYVCLGMVVLLLVSALLFPSAYIPTENTFGWTVDLWPGGYRRLVALVLLGSAPWSQAILSALVLASVARVGSRSQGSTDADPLDHRTPLYTEAPPSSVTARFRLAAGLFGYRVFRAVNGDGNYVGSADWASAVSRVGIALSLAALSLACLAAPKITAAEMVDLETGYPLESAASGLVLSASREATVTVEGGSEAISLRPGATIRRADLVFTWHGQGPALQVRPTGDFAETEVLAMPFLPDEQSKYIAVPGTDLALRATLTGSGADAAFQVQPLTRQGQPFGDPFAVSQPTEYSLPPASLSLSPTQYQVVSVLRLPLWWVMAVALAVLLFSPLVGLLQGPPLRAAVGEGTGVTAVEVESLARSRRHALVLRVMRRLIR